MFSASGFPIGQALLKCRHLFNLSLHEPYSCSRYKAAETSRPRLPFLIVTILHSHELCYFVLHRSGSQGFVSLDP